MILLHRATLNDSKTSRFAVFLFFYEFLWNFKVYSKNNKKVPADTIQMSLGLCRKPPGTFVPFNPRSLAGWGTEDGGGGRILAKGVAGGEV